MSLYSKVEGSCTHLLSTVALSVHRQEQRSREMVTTLRHHWSPVFSFSSSSSSSNNTWNWTHYPLRNKVREISSSPQPQDRSLLGLMIIWWETLRARITNLSISKAPASLHSTIISQEVPSIHSSLSLRPNSPTKRSWSRITHSNIRVLWG